MVSIENRKMKLEDKTVYFYISIDTNFDPLRFSTDSIFKIHFKTSDDLTTLPADQMAFGDRDDFETLFQTV
jgi:hypothetical protein